ncbi:MAG: stage III sporulation protein AE [Clostridia bacterium]|nr:stage III sporulation protein AE [Clostridia bacterium]
MKKKISLMLLIFVAFLSVTTYESLAEQMQEDDLEQIVDNLDTTLIDELLNELDSQELSVFGHSSIKDKLLSLVSGEEGIDADSFFEYVFDVFGNNISNIVPFLVSILTICIIFSLLNSIKGRFASSSTQAIVKLACISLVMVIVFAQIISLVTESKSMIDMLKKQMDGFFPVLLTLMTAIGSSKSVAVYQPAISVLATTVTNVVTVFALPCFLLSIVFHVVGNLSDGIKLKNMAQFFSGAMKWVLSTAFFLFLGVLSVQGITASIYDNIYIRSTKLALSQYVPIIGGYLSEGYNLVISGSVIIKNGVGLSGIVIMLLTIIPLVMQIVVFSLSLKFVSAIIEPLGHKEVCNILGGISKSVGALVAIILGLAFLYFIFLLLLVCTGNLVV